MFDEITAADRSLQVAAYELILDRRLGDLYELLAGSSLPQGTEQQPTNEQMKNEANVWRERLVSTAQQHLERFLRKNLPGGQRQWLPPSRRHIHQGLYLPSQRNQRLEIALALDCSGSCYDYIAMFTAELEGMLGAYPMVNIKLLPFDVKVQRVIKLTENDLHQLETLKLKVGGGTNFKPIFKHFEQETPDVLLILTDGYAEAPAQAPHYPVIWALTPYGSKPTDWGDVLELPGRE